MTQPARTFLTQTIMGAICMIGTLTLGGCQGDSSAINGQTWVPDFQIMSGPNGTVDATVASDMDVADSAPMDAQANDGSTGDVDAGMGTNDGATGPGSGDATPVDAAMNDAQGMPNDAQGMPNDAQEMSDDAQQGMSDAVPPSGDALIPSAADGSAAAGDGGL